MNQLINLLGEGEIKTKFRAERLENFFSGTFPFSRRGAERTKSPVLLSDIRFVEVENLYENLNDPVALELFSGILDMRKSGYGRFYRQKFLPFDVSDLAANHYLICLAEDSKLIPLGGYTRVPLKICDKYQVRFPALNWVEDKEPHRTAIETIINECRQSGWHLTYGCRAVLHEKAKGIITSDFMKEYIAGSFYAYFLKHGGHKVLAAAIKRARTLGWFEQMGFKRVCWRGDDLPLSQHPKSERDSVFIVEMEEPSDWTRKSYEKHRALFDERIYIKA